VSSLRRKSGLVTQISGESTNQASCAATARIPQVIAWSTGSRPEGAFVACSFWPVYIYLLAGRLTEAAAMFDRLLGVGTTSASLPRNTT
jgi:hypothetical protein